jgi:hypothetical protein
MRPRTEALIGVAAICLLGVGAAILGGSNATRVDRDARPSTFLAGPEGSRGLLEATRGLGIAVRRFRQRPRELVKLADSSRQLLVILDPTAPISAPELTLFLQFSRSADLLLAGEGADHLMRCYGYRVDRRLFDSVAVMGLAGKAPRVNATLVATRQSTFTDSSRQSDVAPASCTVPAIQSVTPLLVSPRGLVAIRLDRADVRRSVILVADAGLFRNRALRGTGAGVFALGLVDRHYDRVVYEEYHHGFGAAGSLATATIAWSRQSPWGWAAWQLAVVGLLALLFGAVRFGPAVPGIVRARRSPLEHVRALATALSAAKGHDEAIAAMVRGLRRRLAPPALRARGDWHAWLAQLGSHAGSPGEREAIASLNQLTQPGQPPSSVLRAANAVEDVWQNIQS